MKKFLLMWIAVLGLILTLCGVASAAPAENAIRLFLDSRQLKPDVPPQIMNNVTMVPVRLISEELGAKVGWSEPDLVTIEKNGLQIRMKLNQPEVQVNGASELLENPPVLSNETTLVPVRFVAEKLGLKVQWDGVGKAVSLYNPANPGTVPAVNPTKEPSVPAGGKPAASPSPKPTTLPKPTTAPTAGSTPAAPTPGSGSAGAPGEASAGPVLQSTAVVTDIRLDGDVLRVTTDGAAELAPKLSLLSNPDRLVMDLQGAALAKSLSGKTAGQSGEFAVGNERIAKVRYALYQDNPSSVRVVVDLTSKIEYNLLESKNPAELAISITAKRYKVVLDAGHGGNDSGAVSVRNRLEKDFNLSVVRKLAALLQNNPLIDLHLTRSDDTRVELDDRVAFANDLKADLFVSVHANKFSNPTVQGIETYLTREESRELAKAIQAKLVEATSAPDRGVRTGDLRVTRNTTMPAVLCEIGYLSNKDEEEKLYSEDYQDKAAAAIAAAIQDYLTHLAP